MITTPNRKYASTRRKSQWPPSVVNGTKGSSRCFCQDSWLATHFSHMLMLVLSYLVRKEVILEVAVSGQFLGSTLRGVFKAALSEACQIVTMSNHRAPCEAFTLENNLSGRKSTLPSKKTWSFEVLRRRLSFHICRTTLHIYGHGLSVAAKQGAYSGKRALLGIAALLVTLSAIAALLVSSRFLLSNAFSASHWPGHHGHAPPTVPGEAQVSDRLAGNLLCSVAVGLGGASTQCPQLPQIPVQAQKTHSEETCHDVCDCSSAVSEAKQLPRNCRKAVLAHNRPRRPI